MDRESPVRLRLSRHCCLTRTKTLRWLTPEGRTSFITHAPVQPRMTARSTLPRNGHPPTAAGKLPRTQALGRTNSHGLSDWATPYPVLRCPQLRHSPACLGLTTIPQSTRPVAQYQWSWNTNLYPPSHRRQALRQRTNHRCSHSGDHDESVPPPHHLVSSPQLRWPP